MSKQDAAGYLKQLLKCPRLLACEVVAVRVGLGNLQALYDEAPDESSGAPGRPSSRVCGSTPLDASVAGGETQHRGSDYPRVGRCALRQHLHAIHACPTASAAWLNAAEVTIIPVCIRQG